MAFVAHLWHLWPFGPSTIQIKKEGTDMPTFAGAQKYQAA